MSGIELDNKREQKNYAFVVGAVIAAVFMVVASVYYKGNEPAVPGVGTAGEYIKGQHYDEFEPFEEGMADLTVVFWYGCPHCQDLRPFLADFEAANPGVSVDEKHSMLRESWLNDGLFFYSVKQLDQSEALHQAYFDKREEMRTPLGPNELEPIFENLGIAVDALRNSVDSGKLMADIDKISRIERHYKVPGVPSIIVSGKYRLNNPEFSGYPDMLKAAKSLIETD